MRIFNFKWKRMLPVIFLLLFFSGAVCQSEDLADADIFPLYPVIQPNFDFWLKIYTQYSSDQGVIHDKHQMDRIYGVIALVDPYRGSGRKINNRRIKAAKKKYKAILAKLMKGRAAVGPEEVRVAELFGPDAKAADFRTAMRHLRCQTGQKDRYREGLMRSGAYIEEIRRIFRDANLPQDLAYLPHVESSFNPKAYSKFGAAGMWQFTRSTGKRFMKIGYTIDERRDPILSSYAAAKLLRHNYSRLKTWPLAITAYNHGITGMRRAQRKKGSYERIFKEYRSRLFKFASRNFYSEFLAAREAAKNYRQYFGELTLHTPQKTLAVELPGYVSLPEIILHLDVSLAELRELNPALRPPVFRGQKYVPRGYRLQLPDRNGIDWEQQIARLPQELYWPNQKRSSIYTVRRGDTAGKIAKTHGVKLNDLIAVNNLNRRATIYVNQKLRIPLPEDKPVRVAKQKNTGKKQAIQTSSASKPVLARHTPQNSEAEKQAKGYTSSKQPSMPASNSEMQAAKNKAVGEYLVARPNIYRPQANQMAEFLIALWAVAEFKPDKRTMVSAGVHREKKPALPETAAIPNPDEPKLESVLVAALDLSPEYRPDEDLNLTDGAVDLLPLPSQQQPEIPIPDSADSAAFDLPQYPQDGPFSPGPTEFPKAKSDADRQKIQPQILQGHFAVDRVSKKRGKTIGIIQVEAEETLGHYAEWLDVSASEIRRLNGFRYGRPLHLSQRIKIPLHRVTKQSFEEKRFEYHQELAEDFFAAYRVEKVLTYYTKKGDNIWTLSRREFEVPLWLIKRFNAEVDFGALHPEQKLLIPIVEKNV